MNNRIRLLSTSDIHGMIMPYNYGDMTSHNHGLARISTMVRRLRDENTVLIDNGDILEGSPLTFYHYLERADEICPITDCLREMKYDYFNIGNHDFNYGREAIYRHLENCGAVCITSNVIVDGNRLGLEYDIREIAGRKVGFIGVTTQFVPFWEKEENIAGMEFPDAFETVKASVAKIRDQVDYLVVIYHGGLEKDPVTGIPVEKLTGENQGYRMLTEIEGIDVLIAGHQHRQYCGILNGAAYTEPYMEGSFVSCIDIDTETGEIIPQLLPVTDEPDEEIINIIAQEEQETQKWLDTSLGYCSLDLRVKDEYDARLHKSQLATFINKVQLELTGADISASAIFLRAKGFYQEVTMRDLISTYLFPNTLVVKKMSGKALREYLEFTLQFWKVKDGKIIINPLYDFPNPQHHNYDMLDGVEYWVKLSNKPGQQVVSLKRNGQEISDDEIFTVAMNNYRASGGGGFDMVSECETVKEIQTSCVDLLAEYIISHKNIEFEPINNIHIEI